MNAIEELELTILSNMINRMPVYMSLCRYSSDLFDTADLGIWFDAIRDCYSGGGYCDMITIMKQMQSDGNIDVFHKWMDRVAAAPSVPVEMETHIETLKQQYGKRMMDRACYAAIERPTAEEGFAVLDEAREKSTLSFQDNGETLSDMATAGIETVVADERIIPTGFMPLDRVIKGIAAGEFLVIGGYSKHGKTTLALQIIVEMSRVCHARMYSLEMQRPEIFKKVVSRKATVTTDSMNAKMPDSVREKIDRAIEPMKSGAYKFKIVDNLFGIDEILADARLAWMKGELEVMVLDYIQLAEVPRLGRETRQVQVGHITRKLKKFAQQTGVRVIGLSQMSGDEKERPGGQNFREARDIFQDCNIPLITWRDPKTQQYLLILERSRRAAAQDIPVIFRGAFSRFDDAAAPVESWHDTADVR